MKKLYFGSNLKMYKNIQDTVSYLTELESLTTDLRGADIELFIIPSFTALESARKHVRHILIGAQNVSWEDQGQFTGEISPLMLKELGIGLVMVGHSERRHVFGETDVQENQKVKACLRHGMKVLLCIGETSQEKEYGVGAETLRKQLIAGFHGVPAERAKDIWVAYEPVWSIGVNGTPATPDYAESMHRMIRQCLGEIFGDASVQIPVLYGGSVNEDNASQLIVQKSIDGLFVGRAAWNARQFNSLIRDALASVHLESTSSRNK